VTPVGLGGAAFPEYLYTDAGRERECEVCGKPFVANHPAKAFCSKSHRNSAYRKRKLLEARTHAGSTPKLRA